MHYINIIIKNSLGGVKMFKSYETNRFVIEELKTENKQQIDLLANKLFEASSYSSIESPKNIRRKFGKWLCKKKLKNPFKLSII